MRKILVAGMMTRAWLRRLAAGAGLLLLSAAAMAQSADRAGRGEFSISPIWTEGRTYNFDNGANAKSDTGWGLGLNWAYNFDNRMSAGVEMAWGSANYSGTVAPGNGNTNSAYKYNGTIDTGTLRFVGTYYFTPNQLAPFVTAGIGATYVDTNIPTGPTVPVCWWYPYYGYVCDGATPTKATTAFSYNAGLGVRYDAGRGNAFFMRGFINREWVDFGGMAGTLYWDQLRLDFGWKF
jgi:opacity protein-like surface antigen